MDIKPAVRTLIGSLNPAHEYVITRDLVAHRIMRVGHKTPASPLVFYDRETSREIGLAFGGPGNYIRLNTDSVRLLQAAARDGHARRGDTRKTIESLNTAAESAEGGDNGAE